jgi:uncharacterized protein YdhG (YjbR/CyaY superfamily)
MSEDQKPQTVEDYIQSKPEQVQIRIRELRSYLRSSAPKAVEELKWGKPAFTEDGILWVYSASKNHISLHPTPSVISALQEELTQFKLSENTIQFPLEKPIPKEIVKKIVALRLYEKNDLGIGWK